MNNGNVSNTRIEGPEMYKYLRIVTNKYLLMCEQSLNFIKVKCLRTLIMTPCQIFIAQKGYYTKLYLQF